MEKTKIINGVQCFFSEERFGIDEFHEDDQANFTEGQSQETYVQEVSSETPQEQYSVASYRARLMEMERPIFMRFKLMIRDTKMLANSNLDEKKMRYLRRIFTDDLMNLIQEAVDQTRSGQGGQTVDLILKMNTLGNREISQAGRKFGMTIRRINRIREKMNFIPKMQQEELNSSLTQLVSLIVSQTFDQTDVKTYGGVAK
jgi:hypothetical protein